MYVWKRLEMRQRMRGRKSQTSFWCATWFACTCSFVCVQFHHQSTPPLTHTHAHAHARTHTHTHAHTRTRTHTHARARIHTAGGTTRFVFVIPPAQRYQHNFSSRPDGGGGGVPQASIEPLEGGPVALAEASVKLLQGPVDERSVRPLVCMRGRVCVRSFVRSFVRSLVVVAICVRCGVSACGGGCLFRSRTD